MAALLDNKEINETEDDVDESSENDVLIQREQSYKSNKAKQNTIPFKEEYDSYGTTKPSDQPLYADFLPTVKHEQNGVVYCRMCEKSNHQLEYQQEVDFSHSLYHAQCGDRASQFQVARYFLDGQIVEQNLTLAITWLIQASKAQYDPATQLLQQCYDHQIGIDNDNMKEVLWCINTSNRLKGFANREEVFLNRITGHQQDHHQKEQANESNNPSSDNKDNHGGLSLLQIAQQFHSQNPTEYDRVQSQLAKQREKCTLDSNAIIDKLATNCNVKQVKEQQIDKNQKSDGVQEEVILISSSSTSSTQRTNSHGGLRLRLKDANMDDYLDHTDEGRNNSDDLTQPKSSIKND